MSDPWTIRAESVLARHQSSFPEYYLLCTAGYRINVERPRFIKQAQREFQCGGWPDVTFEELSSALDRLVGAGLMTVLTDDDVRLETERRAASTLPELNDAMDYMPGHVDFTERGWLLYRTLIREIFGDAQLDDSGFNLDTDSRRIDVYAVTAEGCTKMMDLLEKDGDAFTGIEGTTFVGREGPIRIDAWRPNRFSRHPGGYHGVLSFVVEHAQPGVAVERAPPRR
jgi:hypothetical protein